MATNPALAALPVYQPVVKPSSPGNWKAPPKNPPATIARGEPAINICAGPIIRFTGLTPDMQQWRGSVLIAVVDDYSVPNQRPPMLFYRITEFGPGTQLATGSVECQLLIQEYGKSLYRFPLQLFLHATSEVVVEYNINNFAGSGQFFLPAQVQTMNSVFHSCNGFSLGVNPDEFKADLWEDVLRHHETQHFHVMLGGGDQIYSDMVKQKCPPIARWSMETQPSKKSLIPFSEQDIRETEEFYLNHYIRWFGQGFWEGPHGTCLKPGFPKAMATIPSINIYDDHDIIDGFGSYNDETMKAPVFSGIGRIAFKYYMLFQHHTHPDEDPSLDPCWVSGLRPGPYMNQRSRSVYARLGRGVSFIGLDCRTERTLNQVVYQDTYDVVLSRIRQELGADPSIRHLLLMVGVPMAYPRLVWLESLLKSSAISPLRVLAKNKVAMSGLVNDFDGSIEILDDLNDHWCAKVHKQERNKLITELQKIAEETSVRVTILAGDVHLAAMGRFYSNPKATDASAWPEADHRLMLNVVSSAITNTPPGSTLADFLNKRNKIHHMDPSTDEDMIKIFKADTDGSSRNNQTLLPRRNWCSISEIGNRLPQYTPNTNLPSNNNVGKDKHDNSGFNQPQQLGIAGFGGANSCTDPSKVEGPIPPETTNNDQQYTKYPDKPGALSIVLHMEKSQSNPSGETKPYEVVAPLLIKHRSPQLAGHPGLQHQATSTFQGGQVQNQNSFNQFGKQSYQMEHQQYQGVQNGGNGAPQPVIGNQQPNQTQWNQPGYNNHQQIQPGGNAAGYHDQQQYGNNNNYY